MRVNFKQNCQIDVPGANLTRKTTRNKNKKQRTVHSGGATDGQVWSIRRFICPTVGDP